MHFFQRLSQSFDQMKAMATSCGLDLSGAVASGALSGSKLRNGAFRCLNCEMSETCRQVLASNSKREAAPAYCINGALFARLPKLDDETG